MWSFLFFLILAAYLARWVASGWGSREGARLEPQHTAELVRLREEVDQLGAQLLRLQEEQSFMMRLLTEGGAAPPAELPAPAAADPTTNPENP